MTDAEHAQRFAYLYAAATLHFLEQQKERAGSSAAPALSNECAPSFKAMIIPDPATTQVIVSGVGGGALVSMPKG